MKKPRCGKRGFKRTRMHQAAVIAPARWLPGGDVDGWSDQMPWPIICLDFLLPSTDWAGAAHEKSAGSLLPGGPPAGITGQIRHPGILEVASGSGLTRGLVKAFLARRHVEAPP
jgi:hypothetical protein